MISIRALTIAAATTVVLVAVWAFLEGPLRNPEDALQDFSEGQGRAEDQLTDPLVLAGPRVRPLVLSAVARRDMVRRRYALAYVGCAGYEPARETLHRILADETERDYIHADALEALWRLDAAEARTVAAEFRGRSDALGDAARRALTEGPLAECRTWFAALTGRHG